MAGTQTSNDSHLGALFFRRVEELGEKTFVKLQRGSQFVEISWRDFGANVRSAILGLYALGLAKGDKVAIIAENSLEWLCADMATLAGGFPNIVVSPSSSDTMIVKTIGHARCRAAFVEDRTIAERLLNLRAQLPALQHIIVMDNRGRGLSHALTFEELLARSRGEIKESLVAVLESIQPADVASIMYTSGSTGEPKGVMRTQGNLLANISNGSEIVLSKPDELTVIVLSLNHLLGRFGFLKSAVTGRSTAVIEATEQSLNMQVIAGLSPTAITIVPRVMETMWNAILDEGVNRAKWEKFQRLKKTKEQNNSLRDDDAREYQQLRMELKAAATHALGGRIKYMTYGGAPMPGPIMDFFSAIGIPLLGTYGSTECGGVSLSGLSDTRPGSWEGPFRTSRSGSRMMARSWCADRR